MVLLNIIDIFYYNKKVKSFLGDLRHFLRTYDGVVSIFVYLCSKSIKMNDSIRKIAVGASGMATSEVAESVVIPTIQEVETGAGLITQIVILFVTLWGLLKGKKKDQDIVDKK